mmetsp:Transcript_1205/g.873  ORF Transcript_1205/g.873 Transcript_1205/m.873 type:complete len:175 (-) Transcript_1205:156-680(-)
MFLFRHDEKNKIFCYHRVFVLVCIILYTSTGGVKSRKMSETITVESDESDNSDDEKRIISTLSQMTGSSHVAHVDELAASNPSSPDQDYTVSPFRVPLQRAASAPEHDLRKMPFLGEIESSLSHGCVSPFRAASVRDITTIDDSESPQPDRRRFSFMPFASKKSESTRRSERTS